MAEVEKAIDYVKLREQQRIPGYGGHCPMVNSFYGTTYGNATRTSYLMSEVRNSNTSKLSSLHRRGMSAPGKSLSISLLPSSRASGTSDQPNSGKTFVQLPYIVSNTGKRRDEVLAFNQESQLHRKHYRDLTGTVNHISSFTHRRTASAPTTRPTSTPNTGSRLASSSVHGEVPQVDSYLRFPGAPSLHQELKHPKYNFRIPSAREKERRDVYFERR